MSADLEQADLEFPDFELNDWRTQWQAQTMPATASAREARRSAIRQQRRLRAAHVGELLAGIAFLAFSAAYVWRVPGVEAFLWAAVVWVSTLVASAFSVWNWRTLWRTDLKSVSEFVQEHEQRCMAGVRAARFGKGFTVAQLAISAPWLTLHYLEHKLTNEAFAGWMFFLLCFAFGFWVFFAHFRKTSLRKIQEIRETCAHPESPTAHDRWAGEE